MTPLPMPTRLAHAAALTALLLAASPALAVQPETWVHTTEADFQDGETEDVAVTNLGDLKLARAAEALADLPEGVSIVFDAVELDGEVYLAGGPEAAVLRYDREAGGFETLYESPGEQVFTLTAWRGGVLLGVSGAESSRLVMIGGEGGEGGEAGDARVVAELPGVRYVWDVLPAGGEGVYVATGAEGRVWRVTPVMDGIDLGHRNGEEGGDGGGVEAEGDGPGAGVEAGPAAELVVVLDTEQVNVLCLATDSEGRLYAGTDTQGLVFRVTFDEAGEPQPYVLLDAAEPEIGALAVMDDGTVYAGTADANQARPGRLEEPTAEEAGRPAAQPEQPGEGRGGGDEGEAPSPDDLPETPPRPAPVDVETSEDDATDPSRPAEDDAGSAAREQGVTDTDTQPTPEQYDRLRELVRARLDAAREGEAMQVGGPGGGRANRGAAPGGGSRVRPAASAGPSKPGNAVYRIDPEGFVSEVFRESVMILSLTRTGAGLIAATGNQGQVFRIDPDTEETLVLTDLDAEQVPAALPLPDGSTLLGAANPGRLVSLSADRADRGAYTSRVLDASQVSLWGTLRLTADVPPHARLEVQTRSGNVGDPDNPAWSRWTDPVILDDADHPPLQPREVKVTAPPARFFQYRLTLVAPDAGDEGHEGDRAASAPTVGRVEMAYVMPNLPPAITAITADRDEPDLTGDEPAPTEVDLAWEATDPNEDRLTFDLHFRPQSSERMLTLAEDLEQAKFTWQTRRIPDGWYLVKVTARDALDNPPDMARTASRVSDPILVDHTPPGLQTAVSVHADGSVTITGEVKDARAPVASIAYIANDDERYTPVLPEDLILDSTSEAFEVTVPGFAEGPHVVTLRAVDAQGNAAYRNLTFTVGDQD